MRKFVRSIRPGPRGAGAGPISIRYSSFPFLSGDTFRSAAGLLVETDSGLMRRSFNTGVLFVDADVASTQSVDSLARQTVLDPSHTHLIIHNGDRVPSTEKLEEFSEVFSRIFCVNAQDGIPGVTPIPIGLENARHRKNGRLRPYFDLLDTPSTQGQRKHRVVSSFSIGTNRLIRAPLATQLGNTRHGFQGMKWKGQSQFHSVLQQSLFVIAPPGNGADTHRTWEALYCGAIPVVLKEYFPTSLSDHLPIVAVESFDDFLGLSDTELDRLYVQEKRKSLDLAFAPMWIKRVTAA